MSAVQLTDRKRNPPSRWGFDDLDLQILRLAGFALGQAMERELLAKQLGRQAGAGWPPAAAWPTPIALKTRPPRAVMLQRNPLR